MIRKLLVLSSLLMFQPAIATETGTSNVEAPQTMEDLYLKVFGVGTSPVISELDVSLTIDQYKIGVLKLFFDADGNAESVEKETFYRLISGLLDPSVNGILFQDKSADRVSLLSLNDNGLSAYYNINKLSIELEVPLDLRAEQNISLSRGEPDLTGYQVVQTQGVSGFVNTRFGYLRNHTNDTSLGSLDLNGSISIGTVALQFGGDLSVSETVDFRHADTKLIWDMPGQSLRVEAGQILNSRYGLANSYKVIGLAMGQNFDLNPYENFRPINQTEFNLDRPSSVNFIVNGVVQTRRQLLAGRYKLSEFMLSDGINEANLVIEDDRGQRQTLTLEYFSMKSLLREGVSDWRLSAGKIDQFSSNGDLAAMGHYYKGFSETITAGGYFSFSKNTGIMGSEVSSATKVGTFNFQLANSIRANKVGYSASMGWQFRDRSTDRSEARTEYNLKLSYSSSKFGETFKQTNQYRLYGSFNTKIGSQTNFGLTASITYDKDRKYSVWSNISQPLTSKVYLSVSANVEKKFSWNAGIGISVRMKFGGNRGSARSIARTNNYFEQQFGYQGSKGNIRGDARVIDHENGLGADINIQNFSTRHAASVQHRNLPDQPQTTLLTFETAVASAGGKVAIGNAVKESFAIITTKGDLNGQRIWIEKGKQLRERSNNFGPILISDLQSYTYKTISVEAPNLDINGRLQNSNFAIKPSYLGGIDIELELEKVIIVRFQVVTGENVLSLASGVIMNSDGLKIPFFTNRAGKVTVELPSAGNYQIKIEDAVYDISIPDSDDTIIALGTFNLSS